MPAEAAIDQAREVAEAVTHRPLDWLRPTTPQRLWMSETAQLALWLDGNQLGKSTAILADIIHRCRGTHPYLRTHRPPINALIMGASWPQMAQAGGFMAKLWSLLPKNEIDPSVRFVPGFGITGKPPRVLFVRGPGAGSVISFGTFVAGADRVQGSTLHAVAADEPIPAAVYEEVVPRVMREGGVVRLDFTPRPGMPNMDEMRKRVEEGVVKLHNYGLLERNCWPEGAPAPFLPAARIEAMLAALPASVRRMRQYGDWEPIRTAQKLYNFARANHVRPDRPPPGAWLCVSIDHSAEHGRQMASLVAMTDRDTLRPRAWVIDQAHIERRTTPQQDAGTIVDLIERQQPRLTWRDIDGWIGDRAVVTAARGVIKSNEQLRKHLAARFGVPLEAFPRFRRPDKWLGSVEHWTDVWNSILGDFDVDLTPHCMIHPRCERVIQFAERHEGDPADPLKDAGDTVRYALELGLGETSFAPFRSWRG